MHAKSLVAVLFLIVVLMLQDQAYSASQTNSTVGEQRVFVLPVEFTDNQTTITTSALDSRMDFVNSYIRTASYNKTWISYQVFPKWILLNGTFKSFSYSLYGCPSLAAEAIKAVQSVVNFSSFQHVLIVHTGYNFDEMRSEYTGSNCASVNPAVLNLAIVSLEDSTTVWVHEILHSIGGYISGRFGNVLRVQDLYYEDLARHHLNSNIYVNDWDIMSCGCGGMTAWTKMELGWIPRSEIQNVPVAGTKLENLSSLDSSSSGTKVLKIPIKERTLLLVNGSTITAWTYFLIEYRTPVGIDENLTSGQPVVLVTMVNETRYFDWQSGPLVVNSSLYFKLGSIPSYQVPRLNLTISVLDERGNIALVLVTNNNATPYIQSAQRVDYALQNLGTEKTLKPFMGFALQISSVEEQTSRALQALYAGNLSLADDYALKATQQLSQAETILALEYELPFFAIDAVAMIFVVLYVLLRKPSPKFERYYVLQGRGHLATILVIGPILVGIAATLTSLGVRDISNGVISASNALLSCGWFELLKGTIIWIAFFCLAWLTVREAESDIEEEPETQQDPTGATDNQKGTTSHMLLLLLRGLKCQF